MIRMIGSVPAAVAALLALGAMLPLGGCVDMITAHGIETETGKIKAPEMWTNLEVLSLVGTHKTLFDHVATWVTGRDCSTPRAERLGAYCVDWPGTPPPPPQVYCYATLGRPTCYAQAYLQGNDRLIGFVPASAPIR